MGKVPKTKSNLLSKYTEFCQCTKCTSTTYSPIRSRDGRLGQYLTKQTKANHDRASYLAASRTDINRLPLAKPQPSVEVQPPPPQEEVSTKSTTPEKEEEEEAEEEVEPYQESSFGDDGESYSSQEELDQTNNNPSTSNALTPSQIEQIIDAQNDSDPENDSVDLLHDFLIMNQRALPLAPWQIERIVEAQSANDPENDSVDLLNDFLSMDRQQEEVVQENEYPWSSSSEEEEEE